jgi:outer membrane protein assembly factor BamB
MGSSRKRNAHSSSDLRYKSLVVITCIVGLLAVELSVAALMDPQEARTLAGIFHDPAASSVDWTQFGFTSAGTRNNSAEAHLTASTVAGLHLAWRSRLPDIADSTPALLHGLIFPDGTLRNVLYLTTKTGGLVAVDADAGALLWTRTSRVLDPNKITTSSPYADAASGTVYSYGLDGRIHKYDAITGREIRRGGWPVRITTMPQSEKESSALTVANGYLYVTTASFGGDAPPYQGHLVVIDLANGTTHVFNTICSDHTYVLAPGECRDNGAGIWARPGVVVDPHTGDVWLATGNGPYTADKRGHDWGDSVLELSRDGTQLLDAYTPRKPNDLYTQDLDLGSSAPALLPVIPASSTPYLAVQAGKEGVLRLLNRQNLSGKGGSGYVGGELQTLDAPNHCPVLTQPAVWSDPAGGAVRIFVASQCAIGGYQIQVTATGKAFLRPAWTAPIGATSPVVAGGVIFAATTGNKEIVALDPHTGHQLWSSVLPHARGTIGYTHWENPIVVNGRLYCTDENGELVAYGL